MRRIESEVDDVLRQADEAEEAAAAAGQTGQTSGTDDAVDSATGQRSTGSTEVGDAARLDDSTDARLDDSTAAAGHGAESTPPAAGHALQTPLRGPAARHFAARVRQRTLAKARNTVIEPGVDVAGDLAGIDAGQATRVDGNFVINGRTYGMHDGTLYPISGLGIHQLSRGSFKALGVMNEFGNTERAARILDRMEISAADRAQRSEYSRCSHDVARRSTTTAVGDSELQAALAKAFSIPDHGVAIVHSIEDIPAGHPVVAEVRDAQGDFELALSIYTSAGLENANPVHVIQRLCEALRNTALISDDSLDPYTMLLLGQGTEIRRLSPTHT